MLAVHARVAGARDQQHGVEVEAVRPREIRCRDPGGHGNALRGQYTPAIDQARVEDSDQTAGGARKHRRIR